MDTRGSFPEGKAAVA